MVQIDIEMPKCCDTCPCSYDGDYSFGYCEITGTDLGESSDKKRLDDCPMKEVEK